MIQQLSRPKTYCALRNTAHAVLRNFETSLEDIRCRGTNTEAGSPSWLFLARYYLYWFFFLLTDAEKRSQCLGSLLAALWLSNPLASLLPRAGNTRLTGNRWAGPSDTDSRGLTTVQTQLILKSYWNEFTSTIWLSFDKECKGAFTQLLIKRGHYSPGREWHSGQINGIYC